MITLHRHKDDEEAAMFEEKLQELVLAYRVEELENPEREFFIEDGGSEIKGEKDIEAWFRELESELSWQRSISGDGCYIHPDTGKVC